MQFRGISLNSGLSTFASGTPVYVTFTTVDGADITGRGDPVRFNGPPAPAAGSGVPMLVGDPILPRGERSLAKWFNTAAFVRPARGNPGDSPKDVVAAVDCGNCSSGGRSTMCST